MLRHERAEKIVSELEERITSTTSADVLSRNVIPTEARPKPLETIEENTTLRSDRPESADDSEDLPIDSYLDELRSLLDIVSYAVLAFSVSAPLVFAAPPWSIPTPPSISNYVPDIPNAGPLRLSTSSSRNEGILTHEAHLYGLLRLVDQYSLPQSAAVEAIRDAIRQVITDGLQEIMDIKVREWNAQRADPSSAHAKLYHYNGKDRIHIDCGKSEAPVL